MRSPVRIIAGLVLTISLPQPMIPGTHAGAHTVSTHATRRGGGSSSSSAAPITVTTPRRVATGILTPRPPTQLPAAHVDIATTDPRIGIDETSSREDLADTLGARWTRIPFVWNYVEPAAPTAPIPLSAATWPAHWNPFVLGSQGSDAVIDSEVARGRAVVGLLLGTPAWARQNVAWGEASVPRNIDKPWNDPQNYWGTYCYKMARHFAGRIDDWVFWNEVSIPPGANGANGVWTQWRGTSAQYARLLEVAYQAIHTANHRARVILYGDPYWYDRGAYLQDLLGLLAGANPVRDYGDPPGTLSHGILDAVVQSCVARFSLMKRLVQAWQGPPVVSSFATHDCTDLSRKL